MNLCLVRHTTVALPSSVCYGQSDVPLNSLTFEKEAQTTILNIPQLKWDVVFTSPLTRCARLAERAGWKEACRDARLKELDFGEWEMTPWTEIDDPNLTAWFEDYIHVRATEGESFMDQYERVKSFIEEMKSRGYENVLVFTHGGVVEAARILSGNMTFDQLFSKSLPLGGVETLTF
ncbi:MAG: alpha-ribazole phosphatase family protein [Paludibacteraceae bacterium]|nr:alpha-ribazole phosphatase family protein [Paludibacteraceae bacterium]